MKISEFVKKAIKQDKRNIFEESTEELDNLPNELRKFYKEANPIDVEINMDGNSVRIYPLAELELIQADYSLGDEYFVFATCNSDPIFIYGGKVYTCYHGSQKSEKELMADDFEAFLEMID